MPRTESRTKTSIWSSDKDFRKRTGRAQRMYWFLYSQPTISLCGVLALTERRWADSASDETVETVRDALKELESSDYVVVDYDTQEVLVRTFAEHDGVGRSEKTRYPAYRLTEAISSSVIRRSAVKSLLECGPPPPDWVPPDDVADLFVGWSADDLGRSAEGCDRASLVSEAASVPTADTLSPGPEVTVNTLSPGPEISTDTLSGTPPGGVADRTGVRVRAVSSLRLQSPSPNSSLPDPATPPAAEGIGASHRGRGTTLTHTDLVSAITNACTGSNRRSVEAEAKELVMWAAPLDKRIIEETIGWAATQEKSPVLPRALASVIRRKAKDHRIILPEFQPKSRSSR